MQARRLARHVQARRIFWTTRHIKSQTPPLAERSGMRTSSCLSDAFVVDGDLAEALPRKATADRSTASPRGPPLERKPSLAAARRHSQAQTVCGDLRQRLGCNRSLLQAGARSSTQAQSAVAAMMRWNNDGDVAHKHLVRSAPAASSVPLARATATCAACKRRSTSDTARGPSAV